MSLPTPSYVPVAPPVDGLQLAFRAARRRRQGKAAAAGGAGLVALTLLLSLGGGGEQTLVQEQLPPARGTVPAPLGPAQSPAPGPDDRTAAAAATTAADRTVLAAGSAGATGTQVAATAGTAAGPSSRRAPAAAAKRAPVSGPMQRQTSLSIPSDVTCPVRKRSDGSRSVCTEVYSYATSGGQTLEAAVCNTDPDTVVLTYPTDKEVDLVVSARGELWRWSVGHRFDRTPHQTVLGAGECLIWTTLWRSVDQQGRPLPSGTYTLTAEFSAAELPGADRVARSQYVVS